MDCCVKTESPATVPVAPPAQPAGTCPGCGGRTRRVSGRTVQALVDAPPHTDGWRFCGALGCEVVYLHPASGATIEEGEVRVPVGSKSTDDDRPVCYCFSWTARRIREAAGGPGSQTAFAQITAHCKRGEDRCEETNPKGTCCLGDVRQVQRAAQVDSAAETMAT